MAGHQQLDGARESTRKLTYDDFLLFPDDGQRHELIDGEHYVTPSPNLWHQELLQRLNLELALHLRQHGGGRLFFGPLDCILTDVDIVEPDLLLVTNDQLHILSAKHVQGAPALVVEVLSPGTKKVDETIKRELYARAGVREYRVVDPIAKRVTVYARQDTGPMLRTELGAGRDDSLTTPLLPGFQMSLARYFAPAPGT